MSETIHHDLYGTGVALVTPFDQNRNIDYMGFQQLLGHVAPHVDYLVVNGTTAEAPTLSKQEKYEILQFVLENTPVTKPIVYGIGGNHTHEIIDHIRQFNFQGVQALLSVSPAYNRPSQEGIYQHYIAIADAAPVPIILYNVPARTGSNISATTTLRLSEHPNIIGIKEASGNLMQCLEILSYKPSKFLMISGDDMLTVPLMSLGGVGVISVIANAVPASFSLAVRQCLHGEYPAASSIIHQLFELTRLIFEEGNPAGVKLTLEILGICQPWVRLPLVEGSASLKKKITVEIQAIEQAMGAFQPMKP